MLSQEIPCYVHEATKDTGKQCLVTDSWLRARKMVHSVQKFARTSSMFSRMMPFRFVHPKIKLQRSELSDSVHL